MSEPTPEKIEVSVAPLISLAQDAIAREETIYALIEELEIAYSGYPNSNDSIMCQHRKKEQLAAIEVAKLVAERASAIHLHLGEPENNPDPDTESISGTYFEPAPGENPEVDAVINPGQPGDGLEVDVDPNTESPPDAEAEATPETEAESDSTPEAVIAPGSREKKAARG